MFSTLARPLQRLEDQYRDTIVRKLRAEADRIEAGGSPQCYGAGVDVEPELQLGIHEASIMPDVDMPAGDDCWHEDIAGQEWGVYVVVEAVRLTDHHADLTGNHDAFEIYALVDPDTYTGPNIGIATCPECEWEGRLAPGADCPSCAATDAEGDGDA